MLSHSALLELLYDLFAMLMFISYLALMVVIVVRVVMTRRALGVSLSWLILIFTIPFLGVSLYLLFGEVRLGRKRVERARAMYEPYARWIHQLVGQFPQPPTQGSETAQPLVELVAARLGSPMLGGNQVALLTEPNAILFALAQDIREASASCYLEFYIWQAGGWADRWAETNEAR